MVAKDWIKSVNKNMKRKGTVGAFTKQAKAKKMSVQAYAKKVIKDRKGKKNTPAQTRLLRRAVFARNMGRRK